MFGWGAGPERRPQQWHGGGIDEAVLTELRGIRAELLKLTETVAKAPTHEDLDDYVRRDTFDSYVEHQRRLVEHWRGWLPVGISTASLLWVIVGPYVHIGLGR